MALKILNFQHPIFGITFSEYYVRFEPTVNLQGSKVTVKNFEYASKEAFKAGAQPLPNVLQAQQVFDDFTGGDVVKFASEQMKKEFINTYKTEPILEPKTDSNGNPVLNTETGEAEMQTVGTKYFFTENDFIIDL